MIYLASPFSHNSYAVRQHRFLEARRFTIEALRNNVPLFSPIVYGMDMEKEIGTTFEPWLCLNNAMVFACEELWCLCLEGWAGSRGVLHELDLAHSLGKPVHFYGAWGDRINAGG